jgi:cell division GTPase FtsZ
MENRIVIQDVSTGEMRTKTDAEIVRENELLAQKLAATRKSDALKEAIRNNDFRSIPKIKEEVNTQSQENNMTVGAGGAKPFSINFGVIGLGQCGSRLAEVMYGYGYQTLVFNTAQQDLKLVDLPEDRKHLVGGTLGGTGKDIELSAQCFENEKEQICQLVDDKLQDAECFIIFASGGGGTGSGAIEPMINWLSALGKPIVVVFVLPGAFDDSRGTSNALTTLDRLGELAEKKVINSLILVDNSKIEALHSDLSQANFFKLSNKKICQPIADFNTVSTKAGEENLDSMDWARALMESGGCTVFGSCSVAPEQYENDDTALMSAVMSSFENGLLASGFDLAQSQCCGLLVLANRKVLENVPYSKIAFLQKWVSDELGSSRFFKGTYEMPFETDDIVVHFIFSGLSLPATRVADMREQVAKNNTILEAKKKATKLTVGLNNNKASAEVDRKIAQIKQKTSGIGKLLGSAKVERRR